MPREAWSEKQAGSAWTFLEHLRATAKNLSVS